MSRISTCPQCARRIALPESLDSSAEVQCPLCEARYTLAEVLDAAELVPMLVIVGAQEVAATEDTEEALAAVEALEGAGSASPSEAPDAVVSIFTTDETPEEVAEEVLASDTVVGLASATAPDDGSPEGAEAAGGGFAIDTGEAEPTERSLAQRARTGPPQRGRKPKSVVREFLGIVLGGAAGLLIAYYCLNFFGGAQFDMLKIPLPLVPHTYQHWPGAKGENRDSGEETDDSQTDGRSERPDARTSPEQKLTASDAGEPDAALPDAGAGVPAGYVGPVNPQFTTPQEVAAALEAALKASGSSVPAERVVFEGVREMNGRQVALRRVEAVPASESADDLTIDAKAYEKLADLAAIVPFVQADDAAEFDALQAKLKAVLTSLSPAAAQIAPLAEQQLDRREPVGVFLVGNVKQAVESGPYYGFTVKLAEGDRTVAVFTDRAPEVAQGDHVALMGRLVATPRRNLPGYVGSDPVVIWLGPLAKLP